MFSLWWKTTGFFFLPFPFCILTPDLWEVEHFDVFPTTAFDRQCRTLSTFTVQLNMIVILLMGVRDVSWECLNTVQLKQQLLEMFRLSLRLSYYFFDFSGVCCNCWWISLMSKFFKLYVLQRKRWEHFKLVWPFPLRITSELSQRTF